MKAGKIVKEFVKKDKQAKVGVIAINKKGFWFHVHNNEDIPSSKEWDMAIHIR